MVRVLTQEIPGPEDGTTRWLARSVTTGHVAGGSTESIAVERLLTGIRILFSAALAEGTSAQEWFEHSVVTEAHFVHEFKRQESAGRYEDLPSSDWSGCRIASRKALYSHS